MFLYLLFTTLTSEKIPNLIMGNIYLRYIR